MELTPESVFSLLQSKDKFPVDFDDAWKWIGYSRKDNAKQSFENAGFLEEMDFRFFLNIQEKSGKGRPTDKIYLTVDCFKSFSMMAGTAKGKEVRKYFLECERRLWDILEEQKAQQKERVVKAVVQEDHDPWVKRFEDEFFVEAYRITGWKRPEKGHPACMGQLINQVVYDYFPEGVPERLREVNPKNEKGRRSRKHHQYLTTSLGIPVLNTQKAATIAVMRLSPDQNPEQFRKNMLKACGTRIQLELPVLPDVG